MWGPGEWSAQSGSVEDFRLRMEGIPGEPIGHDGGDRLAAVGCDECAAGLLVEVDRDGLPAELIVDGGANLLDLREGIGFRCAVELNSHHPFLRMIAGVEMGGIEKQFPLFSIPCVGISIVVSKRSGFRREDERQRMGRAPFHPGRMLEKDRCESLAGQRACNGMHRYLRPQALRLMVVHEEIALIEQTGDTERIQTPLHDSIKRDAGAAERAIGDDHGGAADRVVDDLMPIENLDRVRLGFCSQCESQDAISVLEERSLPGWDESWREDGGNPVFAGPSIDDLIERYTMLCQIEACGWGFPEPQPSSENENGTDADEEHPTPFWRSDIAPECFPGGCRGKQRWLGLIHLKNRYTPAAIGNNTKLRISIPLIQDAVGGSSPRRGRPWLGLAVL